MSDEARLAKAYKDIREAGYKYASDLYSGGVEDLVEDVTKDNIYDCFCESAHHEGIEFALFEDAEGEHVEYLKSLAYDEIAHHFCEGIRRLLDEKFRDA